MNELAKLNYKLSNASRSVFSLESSFTPTGDQPYAIKELISGINNNDKDQVLLGVTGSGKTFTMAHVINSLNRPSLLMAPNKTLAAQLYGEMKDFFPNNAVEYFVSYYDYYQPEAYVPRSDTYIEKESSINDQIDRMRHSATRALLERKDVIIVASVSCIFGLGSPDEYQSFVIEIQTGDTFIRSSLISKLIDMQYERNDYDLSRGRFRVKGDTLDILPAYEELGIRIQFWGDEIESVTLLDPLTGEILSEKDNISGPPNS